MIRSISLRNFKRHESLDLDLGPGLTAIKGANAAGKSTFLKAILYSLFGVNGSGSAKAHIWNWNAPANADKYVELVCTLPGHGKVTVKRSDRVARVTNGNGDILANGHDSVTAFIEETLGLDAKSLLMLMYSPQGECQALLSMGPTAIQRKVEDIGKTSVIDKVLALIGADVTRMEGELVGIGEIEDAAQLTKDVGVWQSNVKNSEVAVAQYEGQHTKSQGELKQAEAELTAADRTITNHASASRILRQLQDQHAGVGRDTAAWRDKLALLPENAEADAELAGAAMQVHSQREREISTEIAESQATLKQVQAKEAWLAANRPKLTEALKVEDTIRALEGDLTEADEKLVPLRDQVVTLRSQLQQYEKLLSGSVCPTCKREFEPGSHAEAERAVATVKDSLTVAETAFNSASNTRTQIAGKLSALKKQRQPGLASQIEAVEQELQSMPSALALSEGLGTLSAELAGHTQLKEGVTQQWKILSGQAKDLATARAQIANLVANQEQLEAAASKAQAEVNAYLPLPDITPRQARVQELSRKVQVVAANLRSAEQSLSDNKTQLALTQQRLVKAEADAKRRRDLEAALAPVKELQAFLRKNRARLCEELWDGLLQYADYLISSTTQGRFTGFRRTQNGEFMITEYGKEFPVDELSGGFKSVAGLALRCAMTKIFYGDGLPLLLDEVSGDLNEENSALVLGMLQGLRSQVIFASHRVSDSSLANEIVEVG